MSENYQPPPHSEETERAVLGAVLLDNSLIVTVVAELTAEDFHLPINRNAFAAMKVLYERDGAADINPVSLAEQMRQDGNEIIYWQISRFTYGLPPLGSATLKGYIKTLRQKTASRQMLQLIARTDEWLRRDDRPTEEVFAELSAQFETIKQNAKFGANALRVACMADIEPQTVTWLWRPYIPKGKLTIIEGDGGIGKSWLLCAIASAVSRGGGLPDAEPFEAGKVLLLSAEDGLADTLRPRLDAVGADVTRVYAPTELLTLDPAGLFKLENIISEYAPLLVGIDPLFAFTGSKVDIHRANEARSITAPLAAIAERHDCAIVAIRHLNKSRGNGHAGNAGIGSVDFHAAARSVLLVGKDPDDEAKRALCQTKSNLSAHGEPQGYTVENGQFRWTGTSNLTAARILSFTTDADERNIQAEAIDFLRAALADGARPAKEITAEAAQVGLTIQNLRTARTRLNIRSVRKGGEFGGKGAKYMWSLPDSQDVEGKEGGVQDVKEDGS